MDIPPLTDIRGVASNSFIQIETTITFITSISVQRMIYQVEYVYWFAVVIISPNIIYYYPLKLTIWTSDNQDL